MLRKSAWAILLQNPEVGIFRYFLIQTRVWLSWALSQVAGEEELSIQCVNLHLHPARASCPQALDPGFYPFQRLSRQGRAGEEIYQLCRNGWCCAVLGRSVVSDSFATPGTVAWFSVQGILQARTLKWVTMVSSRGSSQLRDQTQVSHIAGRFFTVWASRETQEWMVGGA